MQKCESRTKRVMSAIIAGMMALQVVAPTISYADDTVASTVSSEDNSDVQVDPGVPVQTDTASSNTVTEPDSSESLEETADSEQTDEIQDDTVSDSQGNETNTQEETAQDTVQQNDSGSETTESESVRTVTVTLNKNGGIFEPEWLETANEDPIAAYLGTETNDIAIEDTGDTIVATVTDRDSISIPVALSGDDSLYFTGWDVSSGSYDADNETLTFDDGVDAYVLTAVYNSVADEDQQLIENKEIFDEQAEKNVLQQKLSASGISLYEIDEEMVGGYEKEISKKDNLITITNTHAPEKLDLIVNVVWNDANNQDGYRPDAATIHMSGTDGTQDTRDFTKSSSWTAIVFKDLDHYKDGNEIKYTVTEDEIPQYTTSIAVNGNVVTVTNTHIPEITLRNISVIWEDNDDQDGIRPDAVNIKLKGNDKLVDSSELNEDVKWKHSFTKLPVRENGNEISYTAEENEIPGYTTTIEKTDTGYVFTNTHIPETVTVTVDKVWDDSENQDGLRPDTIHIKLVSNGIAKDAYLDADSNWHLEFEGLPKYRDHGILNEYSVQEVDVDSYTSTVTTKDGYAFTIENDHVPAVIDIPITEEWIDDNDRDGLRPDSHTVVLVDGTNAIEEVVLDKNNGYGVVLKNMPKYKNGVEINYQIKDFKVDGYTTNIIKSDSVKDFNITNTHVPEMVTVTVTEGWHDQSDYDKIRPEKVTLTLTGSDGNVYEKTVTKDTWTTAFSDLPKNSKGEQIIYTLTQEGIKGYKTTITDNETGTIAVINTHEPVKTITVTVTWNDENNKDNIRPDKVTVKLANGTTAVSTKEINNDSWKHVFENIIVFNGDGKASSTVTQDAVNGYTTEIKASDDGNTIEIINTHVPVAPPKEEPKQEETATPAAPAPVVEIKTEPTTTVIETPNKQTGISFMDGLFG